MRIQIIAHLIFCLILSACAGSLHTQISAKAAKVKVIQQRPPKPCLKISEVQGKSRTNDYDRALKFAMNQLRNETANRNGNVVWLKSTDMPDQSNWTNYVTVRVKGLALKCG